MARKSGFEEMVEAAALLPWYVSLVLAFVSYFFFHALSLGPVPNSPGQMEKLFLIGAAAAFQYIVPLVCICGSLFSLLHARRKRQIFDKQNSIDSIRALSWREFEWLVSEAYRRKGYEVIERGGHAPDGGVDLELLKDGRKAIVQCKRWNSSQVGVSPVREAYGVMIAEGAQECVFVSSGKFTRDAARFAIGKPIQLIDGKALLDLIKDLKAPQFPRIIPEPETDAVPTCPDCGSGMIRRIARRGSNAGGSFWGCSKYPACLGKRSL